MYRQLVAALKRRVTLDTRSLAVFRIVAGILVIADVLLRLRNFTFFYTDGSAMPVWLARELTHEYAPSVFFISGSPSVTLLLFGLHLLVGIALLVGYHTRIAAVLVFVFVVSLDLRMPLATSYADILFRLLLFWAMFLPLGERFSLDAVRSEGSPASTYTGLAGAFILGQMVAMYISNGSHKTPWTDDWLSGQSLYGILHYDSISWLLGPTLREIPIIMQIGSVMWFSLMFISPILLVLAGRPRYILAIIYAGGHLFMAATVRIGAFPYVALMGLALFCGPQFWRDARWIADRLGVLTNLDRTAASVAERGRAVDARLPRLTMPAALESGRLRDAGTVVVLFLVITAGVFMVVPTLNTVGAIDDDTAVPLESEVQSLQSVAKLSQPDWSFYQGPIGSDEYYVFTAQRADGEVIDVYNDRPAAFDRPHGPHNYKQLDTYRERFYMYSIERRADPAYTDGAEVVYADYLCERHGDDDNPITHLNMWVVEEDTDLDSPNDMDSYGREAVLIHAYACDGEEPTDIALPPVSFTPTLDSDTRESIETNDDHRYIDELSEKQW